MNKLKNNYFVIFFILLFLVFLYIIYYKNVKFYKINNGTKEKFTPYIKRLYRPYYRTGYINIESFITNWKKYAQVKWLRFLS